METCCHRSGLNSYQILRVSESYTINTFSGDISIIKGYQKKGLHASSPFCNKIVLSGNTEIMKYITIHRRAAICIRTIWNWLFDV